MFADGSASESDYSELDGSDAEMDSGDELTPNQLEQLKSMASERRDFADKVDTFPGSESSLCTGFGKYIKFFR